MFTLSWICEWFLHFYRCLLFAIGLHFFHVIGSICYNGNTRGALCRQTCYNGKFFLLFDFDSAFNLSERRWKAFKLQGLMKSKGQLWSDIGQNYGRNYRLGCRSKLISTLVISKLVPRCQFHQRSTSCFYARRDPESAKSSFTWLSFWRFWDLPV